MEQIGQLRTLRLSGWRAIVLFAAGLLLAGVAIALLALGFLFIVLPKLIIVSIARRFWPKPKTGSVNDSVKAGPTGNATIIDGTYQVSDGDAKSGPERFR